MESTIRISETPEDIIEMLSIILREKLHYRSGGCLKGTCKFFLELPEPIRTRFLCRKYTWVKNAIKHQRPRILIALLSLNVQYVGCFFVNGFDTDVYVKRSYRRKGVAKEMFKQLSVKYDLTGKLLNLEQSEAAKTMCRSLGISTSFKELRKRKMDSRKT